MLGGNFGSALSPEAEQRLKAAHARLLSDSSFQFTFDTPPRPPQLPPWLRWLAKVLDSILPYSSWLLWGALILGVLFILVAIGRGILASRDRDKKLKTSAGPTLSDWRPDPVRARTLLSDADMLASEGRFMEAARLLLHRSIEDIEHRRPKLVARAYTSRDIAALDRLPEQARSAFSRITLHVEHSLFGGQPMDGATFNDCRAAYSDFAFPETWTRS